MKVVVLGGRPSTTSATAAASFAVTLISSTSNVVVVRREEEEPITDTYDYPSLSNYISTDPYNYLWNPERPHRSVKGLPSYTEKRFGPPHTPAPPPLRSCVTPLREAYARCAREPNRSSRRRRKRCRR